MKNRKFNLAPVMLAAVLLAACGSGGGSGGGGSTPAPTHAPTLSLSPQSIKTFRLTWLDVSGETEYRLLENPDGSSGYTQVATIDADLQAFLRFYNFERPHRGYRTRGRTPASIFFSQQPEILQQMGA